MAAAGTTLAALRLPLFALLLAALCPSSLARAQDHQGMTTVDSPSYEELSTSLVVNQLAILKMMQDSSNTSCAAVQVWRETEASRVDAEGRLQEALGSRVEGMQEALQALEAAQRQHTGQVLEALNTTAHNTFSKVEQLQEQMRLELDDVRQVMQKSSEKPTTAPPPLPKDEGLLIVHNDSLPSLCSGSKVLAGTMGSLEVVKSGTYSSNVQCSWKLQFPRLSSVTLTWGYIEMEENSQCTYDWVQVMDLSHDSRLVYGRKLCNAPDNTMLKLLETVVPETSGLLVSFRSDGSNERRGFRLNYHTD